MATLDVLTVYQSWKGFQLFDEVMVQLKCTQLTQLRAEAGTSNSFETDMKYM